MRVDPRGRVKDIASASDAAERVLESCDVDFCCNGDRCLRDACAAAGVSVADVERRLSEIPESVPRTWDDVADLVDVAVGSGQQCAGAAIAAVRAGAPRGANAELDAAVDELAELFAEQTRDEERLFERVRALADARSARGPFPEPPFTTIRLHGKRLGSAYERLHERLRRVRALAYAPDVDSPTLRDATAALTHAMVTHMHLVNNELLPRAKALEPE